MAATNYTVIARSKRTGKVILIDLFSKYTYEQALAIAQEAGEKDGTHELICVIETSKILLNHESKNL